MKTLTTLLTVFLFFGMNLTANETPTATATLSGTITNSITSYVSVKYYEDNISKREVSKFAFLDEEKNFTIELPLSEGKIVKADVGGTSFEYYLTPNSNLTINWNCDKDRTAMVLGGTAAFDNTIFQSLNRHLVTRRNDHTVLRGYLEFSSSNDLVTAVNELSVSAYFEMIEKEESALMQVIESNAEVSGDLRNQLTKEIKFESLKNKLVYFSEMRHSNQLSQNDFDLMDQALIDVSINDDSNIHVEAFLPFISYYLDYQLLKQNAHVSSSGDEYFKKAESELEGKVKFAIQAKMFMNSLKANNRDLAKRYYVKYTEKNTDPSFVKMIDSEYGHMLRFLPGAKAPDFFAISEEGNATVLSNYRGQVVYMKFWATWCAPCIQAFNKERNFRKKLLEKGVVLVNVSVDKSERMWLEGLEKMNIDGVNIKANDIAFVKGQYNFETLPIGFFIDENGGFLRLSGDKTKLLGQLDKLLSGSAVYNQ